MSASLVMNLTGILLAGGESRRLNFNKIELRIDKIPLFIDQIFKLSFFCNEILISASEDNYEFISNELARIEDYHTLYYDFSSIMQIPPVRIIRDKKGEDGPFESIGPIRGIERGLEYAKNIYCLVIASDMPFISHNLLCMLKEISCSQVNSKDAFIIKTEKGFETLCGIYSKKCLNIIRNNIEKKVYKISKIFNDLDTGVIFLNKLNIKNNNNLNFYKSNNLKVDGLNFFNINTLVDYNYFVKIWDFKIFLYQKFSKQLSRGAIDKSVYLFREKWKYFFYRQ